MYRRKRAIGIIVLLIIMGLGTLTEAEQVGLLPIPIFTEARIQSQITYDKTAGLYTYSYIVTNPATNTGKIWAIAIDISQPSDSVLLSSEGLTTPRGGEMVTFEQLLPKRLEFTPMIPVGMRLPYGWHGGVNREGKAHVASINVPKILPGETLGGFEIISRGLPTIREVKIEPWWIYVQSDGLTVEEAQQEDQRAREIEASLSFKTKTLGPTAPPAVFDPIAFIDYIISMKHEAFSLGWITNQGIENSLDTKLENAKNKIEQGNITAAKNILNAFINEVEAQGCKTYDNCPPGKHLTPEAYGLLKYNVEYLIGRL